MIYFGFKICLYLVASKLKQMKIIILILIFFPFLLFSQLTRKIIAITDGDTVVVLLEDNSQKTLRLAEVDCPESGQLFGKNAKKIYPNRKLQIFLRIFH